MHGTKLFFHCVFQFFRGLIYRKFLSLFSCNIIRNFRECFRKCSVMDCCFMFVYNIDNRKGMKCNQTNFVFTDSVVVMNMKQADRSPSSIKPQVFSSKLKKSTTLRIYFVFVYFYFVHIIYYQNFLFVFLPRCRGGGESPAVQPSISVLLPVWLACPVVWGTRAPAVCI